MKKLFDFIKNLFAKADEIEQKVEQFVAKSDFISPTIKKDVQSTLNKVNELEAKTKKVVASAVGMGERGSWSSAATFVDPKHKSTKVGFSIPAEMYKHISKTHEVWADKDQSPGAAKLWKTLICLLYTSDAADE